MKATGIVRRIDHLGRFVVPRELRNTLGIKDGDPLEIYTDSGGTILRKYNPGCTMCGEVDELVTYGSNSMCRKCIALFVKELDAQRG